MGKTREVGSADFRKNLAKFLDMVMRGDSILITRSKAKRPIALLCPVEGVEEMEPTEPTKKGKDEE